MTLRVRSLYCEALYLEFNTKTGNIAMHPIQEQIFRSMAPEEKLRLAERLYFSARELKAVALRLEHPDWSEEAVEKQVREIFLYAGT